MNVKILYLLFLTIVFYSCKNNAAQKQKSQVIVILPYTDIDTFIVNQTIVFLKKNFTQYYFKKINRTSSKHILPAKKPIQSRFFIKF